MSVWSQVNRQGLRQAFEVAGVGEFIKVDHVIVGVVDDVADYGGAYEAGAACD